LRVNSCFFSTQSFWILEMQSVNDSKSTILTECPVTRIIAVVFDALTLTIHTSDSYYMVSLK